MLGFCWCLWVISDLYGLFLGLVCIDLGFMGVFLCNYYPDQGCKNGYKVRFVRGSGRPFVCGQGESNLVTHRLPRAQFLEGVACVRLTLDF